MPDITRRRGRAVLIQIKRPMGFVIESEQNQRFAVLQPGRAPERLRTKSGVRRKRAVRLGRDSNLNRDPSAYALVLDSESVPEYRYALVVIPFARNSERSWRPEESDLKSPEKKVLRRTKEEVVYERAR